MKNNIKAVATIAPTDIKDSNYRPSLQNINFTGGEAVATDGFIIAKTASTIPAGMRDATAYKKLNSKQTLLDNGDIKTDGGILSPEPADTILKFPPYDKIEPEFNANNHLKIGLSVSVLEKLIKSAKCIKEKMIVFEFNSDNAKVIKAKCGDVKYLVMPCSNVN